MSPNFFWGPPGLRKWHFLQKPDVFDLMTHIPWTTDMSWVEKYWSHPLTNLLNIILVRRTCGGSQPAASLSPSAPGSDTGRSLLSLVRGELLSARSQRSRERSSLMCQSTQPANKFTSHLENKTMCLPRPPWACQPPSWPQNLRFWLFIWGGGGLLSWKLLQLSQTLGLKTCRLRAQYTGEDTSCHSYTAEFSTTHFLHKFHSPHSLLKFVSEFVNRIYNWNNCMVHGDIM